MYIQILLLLLLLLLKKVQISISISNTTSPNRVGLYLCLSYKRVRISSLIASRGQWWWIVAGVRGTWRGSDCKIDPSLHARLAIDACAAHTVSWLVTGVEVHTKKKKKQNQTCRPPKPAPTRKAFLRAKHPNGKIYPTKTKKRKRAEKIRQAPRVGLPPRRRSHPTQPKLPATPRLGTGIVCTENGAIHYHITN